MNGSLLGREAYERYAERVRLAAKRGVEYKGHLWVEAPFVAGFDGKPTSKAMHLVASSLGFRTPTPCKVSHRPSPAPKKIGTFI